MFQVCHTPDLFIPLANAVEKKQLYRDIPSRWYQLKQELLNNGGLIDESIKTKFHDNYLNYINAQERYSKIGDNLISLGLGVVVSLYFFGAITQNITSVARVVGLCVLLGYQAQNIWGLQKAVIEDKLKNIMIDLSEKNLNDKSSG